MKKKLVFITLILFIFPVNLALAVYISLDNNVGLMGASGLPKTKDANDIDIVSIFRDLKSEIFDIHGANIGGELEQLTDEMLRIPPEELGLGEPKKHSILEIYYWGEHYATAPRGIQVNRINRPISIIDSWDRTIDGIDRLSISMIFVDKKMSEDVLRHILRGREIDDEDIEKIIEEIDGKGIIVIRGQEIWTDEIVEEIYVRVLANRKVWFFPYGESTVAPLLDKDKELKGYRPPLEP